jgi:hypothetical protein
MDKPNGILQKRAITRINIPKNRQFFPSLLSLKDWLRKITCPNLTYARMIIITTIKKEQNDYRGDGGYSCGKNPLDSPTNRPKQAAKSIF